MHEYETSKELVIGGKSELLGNNKFQSRAKHRFVSPDPKFHFISSRKISFYKKVREAVGGYPEYLTKRGEDTYFNYKIEKAGYSIHYCPQAIVQWYMGKDYQAFYTMFRNYTQGDAEVFMVHHIIQSGSCKQALVGTAVLGGILCGMLYFPAHSIELLLIFLIAVGLYKRSPGGFWFDLKFSITKMVGTVIGFRKGVIAGYWIKRAMVRGQ